MKAPQALFFFPLSCSVLSAKCFFFLLEKSELSRPLWDQILFPSIFSALSEAEGRVIEQKQRQRNNNLMK